MLDLIDRTVNTRETGVSFDDDLAHDNIKQKRSVDEALNALYTLPETANVADIDQIVQRLEAISDHHGYFGLLAEINEGFRNVDLAMLRFLASPKMRNDLIPQQHLGFALDQILEGDDPAVLSELTMLVETLLSENAPASALPSPVSLINRAEQFPTLRPLIARVQKEHDTWQSQNG